MIHKVTPASSCNKQKMHSKTTINRSSACTVDRRQRSNSWNAIYSIGSHSKQNFQRHRKSASANTQTDQENFCHAFTNQNSKTNETTHLSRTVQAHGDGEVWLDDFEIMLNHLRDDAARDEVVNEDTTDEEPLYEQLHEHMSHMSSLPPIRTISAPKGRRRPRHRRTRSILVVSPEDNHNLGEYSDIQSDKPQWQLDAECLAHFENVPFVDHNNKNNNNNNSNDNNNNNNNNKSNKNNNNNSNNTIDNNNNNNIVPISDCHLWASGSSSSLLSDNSDSSCGTYSSNSSTCGSEYGEIDEKRASERSIEPQDENPAFDGEDYNSIGNEFEEVVTKRRQRRGSVRRQSFNENIEGSDVCNASYDASTWALSNSEGRVRLPSLDGHEYVGLFLPTISEE